METVPHGAIVMQCFPTCGQTASKQRSRVGAIAAVAAKPSNSPAQCSVAADHRHIVEASQGIAVKVQIPCASRSASHQHELQRSFLARKNKAQPCTGCRAAKDSEKILVVFWTDAVKVSGVRISRLRGSAHGEKQAETKDKCA